jgi:hypothetical protein
MIRAVLAALLLAICSGAQAHRPSDAFVTLDVAGNQLRGSWEIALRDLAVADDLDADRDGQLTWGELRAARVRLEPMLLAALHVAGDGRACTLRTDQLLVDDRVDGRFAWFGLAGECPGAAPRVLAVDYRFLFDLDPTHRGILVVTAGAVAHSAVLGPYAPVATLTLASAARLRQFLDYLREGVHHIWIGADHILFLLSLLLPAVLVRRDGRWVAASGIRPVLVDVFAVVTAFTAAHSITLTLAALEIVRLPGALTESAIALSVFVAAINNVRPLVTRLRWAVAFVFGLVHGFGFASVLGELGLPQGARLLSLVAFNLGVEAGQLSIVLCVVPLIYLARGGLPYQRLVMTGGSLGIAAVAAFWFAQRSGLLT